jgi:hypothetical protein
MILPSDVSFFYSELGHDPFMQDFIFITHPRGEGGPDQDSEKGAP